MLDIAQMKSSIFPLGDSDYFPFSRRRQPIGLPRLVTAIATLIPADSPGPSECSEAAHHHLISLFSGGGDAEMRVGVGWLSAYE